MRLTIGVITHEPYMNNYVGLMSELAIQREGNEDIEIIALVQLSEESYEKYRGRILLAETGVKEFILAETMSPSQARNYILEKSQGDWIAYVDGDCMPGGEYVSSLYERIGDVPENVGAFQGAIYANNPSKYGKYEYFYDVIALFEMGPDGSSLFIASDLENANANVRKAYEFKKYSYIRKIQGFNFALRRDMVGKIGSFNEKIETAEDREYSARINENGYKIEFNLSMEIFHDYNMTLKRILKRKKWHAYGCAFMIQNYSMIYKVDMGNRLLYILDLFKVCKKMDYLVYKLSCEFVFLINLRKCMKGKRYGQY